MTTDDVIARGRRELWDYETYGSFWDGDTVMAELISELEAVRAEAAQWKLLWKQNTETASDAIRERDEVEKENSRLRDEFTAYTDFAEEEFARLHNMVAPRD